MHGRSEKCPYNCQRWQFLWLPVKLPALAVLSALFCVDKTASVGSFDGTFKTAVYGSCSQVSRKDQNKKPRTAGYGEGPVQGQEQQQH